MEVEWQTPRASTISTQNLPPGVDHIQPLNRSEEISLEDYLRCFCYAISQRFELAIDLFSQGRLEYISEESFNVRLIYNEDCE